MHIRQGDTLPNQTAIVTQVWVSCPFLGLSPGVGSNDMLLGEVVREFEHVVTGAAMYKVDFGGVLGTHAVRKESCQPVCHRDIHEHGEEVAHEGDEVVVKS